MGWKSVDSTSSSGKSGMLSRPGSRLPLWIHSPCFDLPVFSNNDTSSRNTLNERALGLTPAG